MAIITISNHGPLIVSSNFGRATMPGAAAVYLSTNAGCFGCCCRKIWHNNTPDMATGKHAIISRGPWPDKAKEDAIEILLDDAGRRVLFSLHCGPESVGPNAAFDTVAGKEWLFTVWTAPRRGKPHKALERPAYYRRVEKLPWLKPLGVPTDAEPCCYHCHPAHVLRLHVLPSRA